VTVADSGRMYTILNERYLKFELYDGFHYTEGGGNEPGMPGKKAASRKSEALSRTKFAKMQVVFDLSSFQLQTTDKKWFQGNRIMRNLNELEDDIDSLNREILDHQLNYYLARTDFFTYYMKDDAIVLPAELQQQKKYRDSMASLPNLSRMVKYGQKDSTNVPYTKNDSLILKADTSKRKADPDERKLSVKRGPLSASGKVRIDSSKRPGPVPKKPATKLKLPSEVASSKVRKVYAFDSAKIAVLDSILGKNPTRDMFQGAANTARSMKSQVSNSNSSIESFEKELVTFDIQWHKILASSLACIAMFLIGAPLGAIIKKGGLGVPFLVSILFFIVYYVFTMQGEKLAKQLTVPVPVGVWMADVILFAVGLFFLRQARVDARFFEADFYSVAMDKIKRRFGKGRLPVSRPANS
jgi:lipopolysaccharide export system permease protein